jgi:GTPase SAR1 family protein
MILASSPSGKLFSGALASRVSAVKVVVLGPPGVGSTALVRRFCVDSFQDGESSGASWWGARFSTKMLLASDHVLRFQIWDVPGGDETLAPVYFAQAHVCLVCFDLSRPKTLAAALQVRSGTIVCLFVCLFDFKLQLLQGISGQDRPNSVSTLVLVGCKADLCGDAAAVLNEAAAAALTHNCAFVAATSAKDSVQGSSVQSLFISSAMVRDRKVLRAPAWVPDK